jgi:hypothetical protein
MTPQLRGDALSAELPDLNFFFGYKYRELNFSFLFIYHD